MIYFTYTFKAFWFIHYHSCLTTEFLIIILHSAINWGLKQNELDFIVFYFNVQLWTWKHFAFIDETPFILFSFLDTPYFSLFLSLHLSLCQDFMQIKFSYIPWIVGHIELVKKMYLFIFPEYLALILII